MENTYEDSSSSDSQQSSLDLMEILENELMHDSYKPSQDTSHNVQQPLNLPTQNQQQNLDGNFSKYKATMGPSFDVNPSKKDDYSLNSILEPWRKTNVGGNDGNNTMTNPPINPAFDYGHQGQDELFPTNFSPLMQPSNPAIIISTKDSLKGLSSKITNESIAKESNTPPIDPNVVYQVRKELNWWRKKDPINKLILTQIFSKKTRTEREEIAKKGKNDDPTTKIPSEGVSVGDSKKPSNEPILRGVVIREGNQGGQNIGTQEATRCNVDGKGKGVVADTRIESSSDEDMW